MESLAHDEHFARQEAEYFDNLPADCCPECGHPLVHESGCLTCPLCGSAGCD
jgi:hypothetical protein